MPAGVPLQATSPAKTWLPAFHHAPAVSPHLASPCRACVQGPPGTGKTRTLHAFIEVLVRTNEMSPLRQQDMGGILAVADTNAAADNLLEGLLQRGIPAVRSLRGWRCMVLPAPAWTFDTWAPGMLAVGAGA